MDDWLLTICVLIQCVALVSMWRDIAAMRALMLIQTEFLLDCMQAMTLRGAVAGAGKDAPGDDGAAR